MTLHRVLLLPLGNHTQACLRDKDKEGGEGGSTSKAKGPLTVFWEDGSL